MNSHQMDYQGKVATIFGGRGFIGSSITERLARAGYTVKIVTRFPTSAYQLRTFGLVGQIVPLTCDYNDQNSIQSVIRGSDLVINCIGILFESRKNSFEKIHNHLPGRIAKACKAENIDRFIHISALASDTGKSRYARSKLAGEQAIHQYFPKTDILRPSVVFGPDDNFFNKFSKLAAMLPFLPLIGGGHTKFQPVYTGDLADAVLQIAVASSHGKTYELGGPETLDFRNIYELIGRHTARKIIPINLPLPLAHLQAALFSILPRPPLTADQIVSLETNNVVSGHYPGLAELGLAPTSLETILPLYLDRYRAGGKFAERKRA